MKRLLALLLTLSLSASLLAVGAGAVDYKDLTDRDAIRYEDAVAVLNKLGVVGGYADGSFRPDGTLTRGAAAKIVATLLLGTKGVAKLKTAAAPYADVPATNTFAAAVSYCKTHGCISGYNDGTFRPAVPLTGYAFAKMLLGVLGYDGRAEGFTGED